MADEREELLRGAYDAFNARDIERALVLMHRNVDWPNGMEGGRVQGLFLPHSQHDPRAPGEKEPAKPAAPGPLRVN